MSREYTAFACGPWQSGQQNLICLWELHGNPLIGRKEQDRIYCYYIPFFLNFVIKSTKIDQTA